MKGGGKREGEGVVMQQNKQSVNLNREFWVKFNIISKEINRSYDDINASIIAKFCRIKTREAY